MNENNPADPYMRFNPKTRLYEPVWWRRDVMPFWLYPDAQFTSGAMVVNASGTATPPFIYKLQHASLGLDNQLGNPLLINRITFEDSTAGTGSADFSVMLKDMGDQTQFMNRPIHVRNFAGTSQEPAGLSEPLFLPTRHNLLLTLDKLSGGAVNVRLFFAGQMFYTWSPGLVTHPEDRDIMITLVNKLLERRKYVFPFYLTTETRISLAANQTIEEDALIGDDGHFEATDILGVSSGAYEVQIFNPQTKQTYMNGTIQSSGAIGNARNPQPLPAPTIIPAGQRLRFRFTDLSGSANKIDICLRGRKIRARWKDYEEVKKELEIPLRQLKAAGVPV